ncbi:hypothetical protein FD12_GL000666 [Lentilactobacillus rapi DSM 19907 = JCM 15042]|nr:hypothetical protein FD12_GL000666 [Lentilactobacillus rapi DSM 19907 = JCM 15042]
MKHYQMYINGEFKDSESGNEIKVLNPSTGEEISTVPEATREEAREAVNAAYEAEKTWKKVPAAKRGEYYTLSLTKFERIRITLLKCSKKSKEKSSH